jgi:signal transduction histidine kinase
LNGPSPVDLSVLMGIRSSKPTFYEQYREELENLEGLLRSLERIARALVSTHQGPSILCREVVHATAEHLGARWVVLALRPGALPDTHVRMVARDPGGRIVLDGRCLPAHIRGRVQWAWSRVRSPVVSGREAFLPLGIGASVWGVLGALQDDADGSVLQLDQNDLRVLTILANQAAASLQNDDVLHRNEQLLTETENLYEGADARARAMAERNGQLQAAQTGLGPGQQRQLMDDERRRLASELHGSVIQQILGAGIAIEWCRSQVPAGTALHERLGNARRMTRLAVEQLRSSIHALSGGPNEPAEDLSTMLRRLRDAQATDPFDVSVEVSGDPVPLPGPVTQSLFRMASECVFNAALHARAQRAVVSLGYGDGTLRLAVADDGDGEPPAVRRVIRGEVPGTEGGYHRGLADIAARAERLHGELEVERSPLGGIQIEVRLPLALIRRDRAADGEEAQHD